MRNFKNKKYRGSLLKGMLCSVLIFAFFVFAMIKGTFYLEELNIMQNIDLTKQSIKRAVVQCYAIEGIYPPDIEYIEKNYGLNIDHDKYFVMYDCFASNLMPIIEVYEGG